MSYEKQTFIDNETVLKAEHLNHIEDGIVEVESKCVAKNQGAANVGKILVVGTDGNLTLADMPEGGVSGDVIGTLDESNNILLSGNLADGTYILKYDNADGTYAEVGTLEVSSLETYTVTQNLTNVTSNNTATSIREGESLTVNLTASDGYTLSTVTVTMGGTDITSSVVSGSVVTIINVIGDVVITAVAEETTVEIVNLAQPDATATGEDAWNSGGWCNDSYIAGSSYAYRAATDGRITTNTITVEHGDTIYVKGLKYTDATYIFIACLNADGARIYHGSPNLAVDNGYIRLVTDINGDDYWSFVNAGSNSTDQGVRIVRFSGYPSGDITDIIITRNQPIV